MVPAGPARGDPPGPLRRRQVMARDTLYYDGACPICRAEVARLTRFTGDRLVVTNIHEMPDTDATPGKARLLERLHLRTADGAWLTGLDANIRAWRHTPFRRLWELFELPVLRPLGEWAYEFWLRKRAGSSPCDDGDSCPPR